MNKLISVVIPTYNRGDLITNALDSVYAQSYRPLEVVVVDDGSTDVTESIVAEWKIGKNNGDDFIMKYIRQENSGGNAARNRGIKESTASVIAFLDSDDLWLPDKLARQMDVLVSDSNIGAVYCGVRHVALDTGEIIEPVNRNYSSGNILSEMLVHDVTSPTSTYIVKREVFDKVGLFDENLQARQDWDMWIRIASKYNIGVVPDALVDYREHTGVRTATNPQKEIDAYQNIMKKYSALRKQLPLYIRQRAKASFYRRMGRVYFHHKISYSKALFYQLRGIIIWPFEFDGYAALMGMFMPAGVRQRLNHLWNSLFGATKFAIKSH